MNYAIRAKNFGQIEKYLREIFKVLGRRAIKQKIITAEGLTFTIQIKKPSAPMEPPKFGGMGFCDSYSESVNTKLRLESNNDELKAPLIDKVVGLLLRICKNHHKEPSEFRGFGIKLQKVGYITAANTQISSWLLKKTDLNEPSSSSDDSDVEEIEFLEGKKRVPFSSPKKISLPQKRKKCEF